MDFTKEASNIERVKRNFAGDTTVRLPIVVPERSSRCVLTTEFIDGTKITDFDGLAARGLDHRQLAERIVTAYCRMIFVDGVYHADPHPGNIFVAEDGAIVFVDFGAVGLLAPHMRQGIPAFFQGVIARDPQRITDAIRTMGFVARDSRSGDVAARVIAYFQSRFLDQLSDESFSLGSLQVDMRSRLETIADLRNLDVTFSQLTSTFQVPKDWVLLERTLLLLLGLCTELDPSWNPMTVIRPYLEEIVLGDNRDWGTLLRSTVKDWARSAITIPDDLQRVLGRAGRGASRGARPRSRSPRDSSMRAPPVDLHDSRDGCRCHCLPSVRPWSNTGPVARVCCRSRVRGTCRVTRRGGRTRS